MALPLLPRASQFWLIDGISTNDSLEVDTQSRCADAIYEPELGCLHATHAVSWEQGQTATSSNDNMLLLLSTIENGIPERKRNIPVPIREYHQVRRHMYSTDGVVICKDWLVILRPACLSALHAAHQGTSAMTSKAETTIFLPGITPTTFKLPGPNAHTAIGWPKAALYHQHCPCFQNTPSIAYVQSISITMAAITPRYSNWPIGERAKDGATGLINILGYTFATYGIPDKLSSDGSPEFTAHTTRQFLHTRRVHYYLSSVVHPWAEIESKPSKGWLLGTMVRSL